MLHTLIDDRPDMSVRQGIEYRLAFPPVRHQLHLLQHTELVGNGGLGHVQGLRQIADTHLAAEQDAQDADPRKISEYLVKIRQRLQLLPIRHMLPDILHNVFMNMYKVTMLHFYLIHSCNLLYKFLLYVKYAGGSSRPNSNRNKNWGCVTVHTLHFGLCAESVMAEVSQFLYQLGELSGETIFIDGTKIEACANKYTFVWKKAVSKNLGKLLEKLSVFVELCEETYGIKVVYQNQVKMKHIKKLRKKLYLNP